MNRLLLIRNVGRFSIVIDLYSFAFPFNIDRYPGDGHWTYRFRVLCFNFHLRSRCDYLAYDREDDFDGDDPSY